MADGGVNTSVSAYLINTGKNLVLIDAGSGDKYGVDIDRVGRLPENLRKAGYTPEQVDIILPTHLHFDHFSGVTIDGKAVFPNATIYIANEEKAFWYDTPMTLMSQPNCITIFIFMAVLILWWNIGQSKKSKDYPILPLI